VGKSALALQVARNVAGGGRPVLYVSLEMPAVELGDRLLCAEARVDGDRFERNAVGDAELARLERAAPVVARLPLRVDAPPRLTLAELRGRALAQRRREGLGLLVVDFLQKVAVPGARDLRAAVEEVSGELKALAKEIDAPVLAIASLNRAAEARPDKRPILSDLRESGAIESDADLVAFLDRDELVNPRTTEPGVSEVLVRKQRGGLAGTTVRLRYDGPCTRFDDLPAADDGAAPDARGWDGEAYDAE
jgi:replicative DNA helicase